MGRISFLRTEVQAVQGVYDQNSLRAEVGDFSPNHLDCMDLLDEL